MSALCLARACEAGVLPLDALRELAALTVRPLEVDGSRAAEGGAVGGATSSGSRGGLALARYGDEDVARPSEGEEAPVETRRFVSAYVLHWIEVPSAGRCLVSVFYRAPAILIIDRRISGAHQGRSRLTHSHVYPISSLLLTRQYIEGEDRLVESNIGYLGA